MPRCSSSLVFFRLDRHRWRFLLIGGRTIVTLQTGLTLDTRPYRMQLPASLKWVEVDLLEILAYKQMLLALVTPNSTPADPPEIFQRTSS